MTQREVVIGHLANGEPLTIIVESLFSAKVDER